MKICVISAIPVFLTLALHAANPIFTDKWTADPAPLVDGDTLYLFTGHDDARDGELFHMEDWLCFSTKDLKTWKEHGPILRTDYTREGNKENVSVPKVEWTKDASAWAAQCVKSPHDGKYYFYFCAISKTDGMCVGVAVADKPTGPYKDALGRPLVRDCDTPSPYWGNDIDPSVFIDADGTPWMVWGNPVCYLAKLKRNMVELDGEIRVIPLPNYTGGPLARQARQDVLHSLSKSCPPGLRRASRLRVRSVAGRSVDLSRTPHGRRVRQLHDSSGALPLHGTRHHLLPQRHALDRRSWRRDGAALRIANDGEPFDPDKALGPEAGHYGLSGMRERAKRAGIKLSFVRDSRLMVVVLDVPA